MDFFFALVPTTHLSVYLIVKVERQALGTSPRVTVLKGSIHPP